MATALSRRLKRRCSERSSTAFDSFSLIKYSEIHLFVSTPCKLALHQTSVKASPPRFEESLIPLTAFHPVIHSNHQLPGLRSHAQLFITAICGYCFICLLESLDCSHPGAQRSSRHVGDRYVDCRSCQSNTRLPSEATTKLHAELHNHHSSSLSKDNRTTLACVNVLQVLAVRAIHSAKASVEAFHALV
jgi:hypothetical protein